MLSPEISVILGMSILIFGILAGFSEYHVPYRTLHISIASVYILLTPLVVYVHSNRFYTKGATDWIAWMHFFLFGFILYLTVKMLKRWLPKENRENFDEHSFIVQRKEKKYDLKQWIGKHPGGDKNLMKAFSEENANKDLEEIWKKEGVSWHINNERVENALKNYEI